MGGYDTPQIMMLQQRQAPKPPWWIITELKRNFDVVEIPATADEIAADIDVVLAIHPGELGDATLYALDQFVLRGGRLLAFLDPFPLSGMNQPYMKPAGSSLGKLLSRWGIEFTADKLVADRKLGTRMRGGYGTVETMPTVLSLTRDEMDSADPAVASLNNLLLFCAGSFSGKPVEGIQQTTLLHTSDDAGFADTFAAQQPGEMILRNLKTDGKKHALAVKLTGLEAKLVNRGIRCALPFRIARLLSRRYPVGVYIAGSVFVQRGRRWAGGVRRQLQRHLCAHGLLLSRHEL